MKRFDEMAGFESDDFEIDLSLAMRPVDAPEGFADRVLERVAQAPVFQPKPSMETMDEFEVELAQAMRHVDAPEGFADRVLARAAEVEPQRAKVLMMPMRVRFWAAGAIAASLLVGAFSVREQRERKEREQAAAQAQRQFDLAVQITGNTLADTRAQIADSTPADTRALIASNTPSDAGPRQQFEMAMQITDQTLASVRAQLRQAGVQLGD